MGVDVTLFVMAVYSDLRDNGEGYVHHSFRMERERDLFDKLQWVPMTKTWATIQLPHGSWSWFHGEERPPERRDHECGWLSKDNYGSPLRSCHGRDLSELVTEYDDNRAILDFIINNCPDHDVVVFWH